MSSGIHPAGHRVLVKPDEVKAEVKTETGIIIPIIARATDEQMQHAAKIGVVIEVGLEAWSLDIHKKPWAKVGDRVSFAKTAGDVMIGDDGGYYRVMNDEDIIAVLDKE